MIYPTVHLNGTSRSELLDQALHVLGALREARTAMQNNGPNGRDYYVQGPTAIQDAMREHEQRLAKINELIDEYTALADNIADQGDRFTRR